MDQLTELTATIDEYLESKSKDSREKVKKLVKQPAYIKLWIFDPDYKKTVSLLQALLADEDPFLADFVLSHFCSGFTDLLKWYKKNGSSTISTNHVVTYLQLFNNLIDTNFHSIKEDLEGPVMSMLYLLNDALVRPDILLVLAHLKQVDKRISDYCEFERTAEYYVDSFLNDVGLQELNSFLYECVSHLIVIFPETVSKYASNESFLRLLTTDISRLTTLNAAELENSSLLLKILYMLSNLCIDESTRNLIHSHYSQLLSKLLTVSFSKNERAQLILTLTALVIVKTWHMPSMGDKSTQLTMTYDIFIAGVITDASTEILDLSLEGLTYLSIKVEAKRMIRNDDDLLITILQLLKEKKNLNLAYGILSILENVTSTKTPDESISKVLEDTEKDDPTEILNFIFHILAHQDLMSSLLALFKDEASTSLVHNSIINLIHNIVIFKETRSIVFEQKGLDILFSHLISTKDNQAQLESQMVCIESVSKILLTSNPEVVVEKYDLIPVAFLVQLVQAYDHQKYQTRYKTIFAMHLESQVANQAVFEVIISLTNLASVPNMDLKKTISNAVLPSLPNFLISEISSIRQSMLELLSNLSDCPDCLQYVFNWSKPDTKKNYDTLLDLLYHLSTGPSQSAILSFFANASVYDLVADVLVENKDFIHYLSKVLDKQRSEEPIVERTLFILINCGQISTSKLREALPKTFNDVLNEVLRNIRSTELRKMCLEVARLSKGEN
ncbi:Myosin motor domain binding protein [Komagataella phaffii CBS 7435]|uniref:Protein containing a UCS (UNC-45/CRO1/SHE4) domain n=2 Tax=Komagataella phaffii TaxID=460519 RepID=C4R0B1_KOMPG|nr:Protein containing a UCS (UNC-45/CRO1/SHE4) domain [Komagataella phaffii GS115]AOA62001.1 GQ67_00357T0 [Komagataella phaffii]CAH2448559.1 Myosin motor domain binding protein [Komagataella phaffii CBS 7435]AOA67255.1 GQ68_01032T0 [Komagataella phaffii GS115]CAY68935.1 Protein containing a UCS (UNC-45/CRO1/SHE4) domain [Komagataella phaffii GS115]CCA38663.1 Myosin motor domain binding protein [Komagataella phaffii CBS 7435]